MKDTPAHKQIRRTRLKASHFIRDHSCRLSCEYEHGPTHAQVQTTWLSVSISSSYFIFQGKLTLLLTSFVSSLLTNHCQSSVTIHRLWPQLIRIKTKIYYDIQVLKEEVCCSCFGHAGVGVLRPKRYPKHVGYLFTHLSSLIIFPYFFKTYVLFGYGVVLRPKPTTRTLLVQRCTPDPNSLVIAAAS